MQGFHRPIYTPSLSGVTLSSDQGVAKDLRNTWERIFFQYEVCRLRWLVFTARGQTLTRQRARHRRATVMKRPCAMVVNPETSTLKRRICISMPDRPVSTFGVLGEASLPRWAGHGPGMCACFSTSASASHVARTHMRGVQLSWPCLLQVDMTWSGHVHLYERTCPILFHECLGYSPEGIPNAPVHMSIGNGGVSAPR